MSDIRQLFNGLLREREVDSSHAINISDLRFFFEKGVEIGGAGMVEAARLVLTERRRQDEKWGPQNHDDGRWALIFLEEIGEFAQAMLDRQEDHADVELKEATAVLLAWLECRLRRVPLRQGVPEPE